MVSGKCEKCGVDNSYEMIICASCGTRLPWGNAVHNRRILDAEAEAAAALPPMPTPGIMHQELSGPLRLIGNIVRMLVILIFVALFGLFLIGTMVGRPTTEQPQERPK